MNIEAVFARLVVGGLLTMGNSAFAAELPADALDDTNPIHPFFSHNVIKPCDNCRTTVIVVTETDKSLPPELMEEIKKIASTVYDEKHQQFAVIARAHILDGDNAAIMRGLNCRLPDVADKNVLYFAATDSTTCMRIPFVKPNTLRVGLERIDSYIDRPDIIREQISGIGMEETLHRLMEDIRRAIGANADKLEPLAKKAITHVVLPAMPK